MTLHVQRGKAPWSMSAFVAVLVSIFLAGGGVFWAFAQTAANADHKVIVQRIQKDEDDIGRLENIVVTNTGNIVDLKQQMAAIQAQNAEILNILKGVYKR